MSDLFPIVLHLNFLGGQCKVFHWKWKLTELAASNPAPHVLPSPPALVLAFYICAGDLNSVPHDAFPHPAISSSHFLRVYVPSVVLPCLQERSLVLSIVRAFVNKLCPAHSVLGAGEEGCTENRDSGIQPQWWANWKLVHEQLIWRQKMQIHDRCLDNPRIFKYISGWIIH